MWIALAAPLLIASESGPLRDALKAAEAPDTLRAAFTVELKTQDALRIYRFDPRLSGDQRWTLLKVAGEDDELDQLGVDWGAEAAPDGRLFADDLRASMSDTVEAETFGEAWRIRFSHQPSFDDSALDIWAAEHLTASAWVDIESARFLRLDYVLPKPVSGPRGVQLLSYAQSYFLDSEPVYGLSYVSAISLKLEARAAFRRIHRDYEVRVLTAEFFFASVADEAAFLDARRNSVQAGG